MTTIIVNDKSDSENLRFDWKLEEDGTLIVEGAGKMPDLGAGNHAESLWQDIRDEITKVQIGEGITEVGAKDFEGCRNLTQVSLPSTLRRIRAYAFKNCTALREITAEGRNFKYIREKNTDSMKSKPVKDDKDLYFGTETFSNVPWAVEQLGNLYCRDGVLYVCFADQDSIRVPGNVHTIAVFAFMNIHAAELILPDSIRCIEDNAFIGASFGKIVMPPDRATFTAGTYKGSLLESVGYEEGAYMKGKKIKVPDLYELAFIKTGYKGYNNSESKIHKIEIREKKGMNAGGESGALWGRNTVVVGPALLRKLKKGGALIGISVNEEHQIRDVKSLVWRHKSGFEKSASEKLDLIQLYLMYPCIDEDVGFRYLSIWSDSFTYFEGSELENAFANRRAEKLMEMGAIREAPAGVTEEWFWSANTSGFGGGIETNLLEQWLKDHPEISVLSKDESREKQKYRWFVSI